jgi:uncharacterized protein DUF262
MGMPIEAVTNSMAYEADRICDVLPRINTSWFLPALQREFVWDSERICNLFDSLMRSYPISSFFLWRVPEGAREDLEVYRFIDSASDFGKHNLRERAFGAQDMTFVLDGQQRLTTLVVGLKGTYEIKKKYSRTGEVQRLHLDLLRDGESLDDQGDVSYGFEFRLNSATTSRGSYWFEVGRILKYKESIGSLLSETEARLRPFYPSASELETAKQNLVGLHRVVFSDRPICYHTETHGDQERMLDTSCVQTQVASH